jgi:hypothetical protein
MAMGINVGDILGIVSNHIDTHNHTYIPHLTSDFFTSLDNKELFLFLKNRHYWKFLEVITKHDAFGLQRNIVSTIQFVCQKINHFHGDASM